ncbi:MAG: type II toxin-antitoxin system ParD family antitoxin [Terracidiphilus sp.]
MPYKIIRLTSDSFELVRANLDGGRYLSADDVVRAALRALHREEATAAANRPSAIAEGDVFRKLWDASVRSSPTPR